METPKFQIPGRTRGRKPGEAPNSVKEMDWANQKPESMFDFLRGRFLALLLMAAVIAGGFTVMNQRAAAPAKRRVIEDSPRVLELPPSSESDSKPTGQDESRVAPKGAAEENQPDRPPAEADAASEKQDDLKKPTFERTLFQHTEAMAHTFQEPLPDFKPLETLDYKDDSFLELYALVTDDELRTSVGRANASNYAYGAEIIYLYYRFLRTHAQEPEKIDEYYKKRKAELTELLGSPRLAEATYGNVMKNPVPYRGQLLSFTGLLMQKHQIRVWSSDEDNNSGVRETWLLVCRDLKRRDELYGVLVPHSARHLASRDEIDNADLVSWKGLFLQRWPYQQKDQDFGEMPLYVAWSVEAVKQAPSVQGTNWVLVGLGTVLGLALIFVFWQTSKDDKRSDAYRRTLRRKPAAGGTQPTGTPSGDANGSAPVDPQPPSPPSEPPTQSNEPTFGAPQD